ncbi:MAG TPA: AMP-binding protein [Anaeromyxobacteraceae bacterium]|nr:AMP-binding protein [Anaeromyxobacteraceae bacterium]
MTEPRPWHRFYGNVPTSLECPDVTLYEALAATTRRVPDAIAWDFFGRQSTYGALLADVDRCAAGLAALGLRQGNRFLISMPTSPPGVIAFYAAIRLGALPAMIHPLSTALEITHYLDETGARMALTLDAFHGPLAAARPKMPLETIVLARISDDLPPLKKVGFWITKGRKIPKVPPDPRVRWFREMMASGAAPAPRASASTKEPAAILFSGGTTGLPKGILLSHRNFIVEGRAVGAWCSLGEGDAMLAALPIFHGFGLGVCVNATLMAGGKAILVPQFSPEIVARRLRCDRPNVVVGVPTLFDALTRDDSLAKVDLSCLTACYCGADTLPREVKERFEKRVADQGGKVKLLEGYGLTEAVSAIMATPLDAYREGSVGVPLPEMLAKICGPDTIDEVPAGQEGEICIAGPAVMLGYLNDREATARALRVHADGRTWLHTGDLGRMDADGFFYFSVRLKRMIKSSGFNVYPAQVEAVLRQHPEVADACVVGVPDPAQVERVVAYVVLRDAGAAGPDMERRLIAHCRERLIKWSCPREVGFLEDLPLTNVGKVDYRELVRQRVAKASAGVGA